MGKWNEPYGFHEKHEVITTKRLFNLNRRYEPGMGVLQVYYNGLLATLGEMYNEVNPYAIEFTFDAEPGDKILVVYQKMW